MSPSTTKRENLIKSLYTLRDGLEMSDSEFQDFLEISKRKSFDPLKVSLDDLEIIGEKANIGMDKIFENSFCHQTAIEYLKGNKYFIGDQLKGNKGSRMRTVRNTLKFLKGDFKKDVMRSLQLSEEHFENDDDILGIHMTAGAFSECSHRLLNREITEKIGFLNGVDFFNSHLKRDFSDSIMVGVTDFLEYFLLNYAEKVEKNRIYSIVSSTPTSISISSVARESTEQYFSQNHQDQHYFESAIIGFFKGLVFSYCGESIVACKQNLTGNLRGSGIIFQFLYSSSPIS